MDTMKALVIGIDLSAIENEISVRKDHQMWIAFDIGPINFLGRTTVFHIALHTTARYPVPVYQVMRCGFIGIPAVTFTYPFY